jgi:hypothetical protein
VVGGNWTAMFVLGSQAASPYLRNLLAINMVVQLHFAGGWPNSIVTDPWDRPEFHAEEGVALVSMICH